MNSPWPEAVFVVHLGATLFMTGLIWFVQVVHYPLFAEVDTTRFPRYEVLHSQRTTWVVSVPMLVEVFTGVMLLGVHPAGVPVWGLMVALGVLAIIWISTAVLQVPCHTLLTQQFDRKIHARLVRTNWIRTIGWSARALLLLWYCLSLLCP